MRTAKFIRYIVNLAEVGSKCIDKFIRVTRRSDLCAVKLRDFERLYPKFYPRYLCEDPTHTSQTYARFTVYGFNSTQKIFVFIDLVGDNVQTMRCRDDPLIRQEAATTFVLG